MKSNILPLCAALCLAAITSQHTAAQWAGGDGAANNPYLIDNAARLAQLATNVNNGTHYAGVHFRLSADISLDMAPYNEDMGWTPIGKTDNPFRGTFDGAGHSVSHLYIYSSSLSHAGLFGLTDGGTVKNLRLENAHINASNNTGGLVGGATNGSSVERCLVSGVIVGYTNVGGATGWVSGSSVLHCTVDGEVNGTNNTGGVAGYVDNITCTSCPVIIGHCYATCSVNGAGQTGGVAGYVNNSAGVVNCYATGAVSGTGSTGGITGMISGSGSNVTNCLALNPSVTTSGTNAGRITGDRISGAVLSGNVAWTDISSGSGPFAGENAGDGRNGADKSAVELLSTAAFPAGFAGNPWTCADKFLPGLGERTADMPIHILTAAYGGKPFEGNGDAGSPYLIFSGAQLACLAERTNEADAAYNDKQYRLTHNVDLAAYGATFNDGAGWIPIGVYGDPDNHSFMGVFDGYGHTVSGLYIDDVALDFVGLFGSLDNATVENLTLSHVRITGNYLVGSVAGLVYNGSSLSNCAATGVVTGAYNVGGVVGTVSMNSSLSNCHASGTVSGLHITGGVTSEVTDDSSLADCSATCQVTGNSNVGGVTGLVNNNSSLTNCYATGTVTGMLSGYNYYVGGVTGLVDNNSHLTNCYATGAVTGENRIGGVTGQVYRTTSEDFCYLTNCYATGAVTGAQDVGGVVGWIGTNGIVTDCAALNPSVTAPLVLGRVTGHINGVLNNSIAWSGITAGGASFPTGEGATHLNGASQTAGELMAIDAFPAGLTGIPWSYTANFLPGLSGNVVDMPDHILSALYGGKPFEGNGNSGTPYIIFSATQLALLAEYTNAGDAAYNDKHYVLANDIDLSASYGASFNDGAGWIPIGYYDDTHNNPFKGVFNGAGYSVAGLYIRNADLDFAGLFGYTDNGKIENLGVVDAQVFAQNTVGSVAGYVYAGSRVEHCYASGTIAGADRVGGVAGSVSTSGQIKHCYSICTVSGNTHVGGVTGLVIVDGDVSNCAALNPSVKATGANVGRVAGDILSSSVLSGNIAWSGMTAGGGTPFSGAYTLNGIDGASFSAFQIHTDGTLGGRFPSTPWVTGNSKLPGFGIAVDMPHYLRIAGAPAGLTAFAGNAQVTLTWTAPTDNGGSPVTHYEVENGAAWINVGNVLTYDSAGLTNGTTYTFKVRAVNSAGEGPAAVVTATPSATATAPGAPAGLTASAGDTQVTLTWTAPTDNGGSPVTHYEIENGAAVWINVGNVLTFDSVGLTNGTTYIFKVRAVNAIGEGPAAVVTATPVATATAPGAPASLIASAGDAQITLTWTAPTSDGGSPVTHYEVEKGAAWINVGNVLTCDSTGLINGTTYTFKVRAANAIGAGPAAVVTATPVATATAPDAPASLIASAGDAQITLTWTAPTSDGGSPVTHYEVEKGAAWINVGNVLTCDSTGLINGTTYTFKVRAANAVGVSPAAVVTATPVAGATAPGAPAGLTATAGYTQVALTWTTPSDGGSPVTRYEYAYGTSANPTNWARISGSGATTTSFIVTGLTNGTTYYFKVRAVNIAGNGAESTEVSSTPAAAYTFAVAAEAGGAITGTANGSYTVGTSVTVTVMPEDDYSFTGWTATGIILADSSVTANSLTFPMPAGTVTLTAHFAIASGNEEVDASYVRSVGGRLYVYTNKPDTIYIYTLSGYLYRQQAVEAGETVIDLPLGCYVVAMGTRSWKVAP